MGNSKEFTIFAGVNGAGKSTLYYTLGDNFGVRLNSDEIISDHGENWRDVYKQIQAVKDIKTKQEECIENNVSFNRETTVPGVNLIRTINTVKQKNYKVNLLYVGVESVDICKERVAKRVAVGGHGVPEDVIESRFNIINKKIAEIIDLCDSVQFFDNSFENIQLVGYKDKNSLVKLIDNCHWLNDICQEYTALKTQWFDFSL